MTKQMLVNKKIFSMCFNPVAAVFFIMMRQKTYTLKANFLEDSLSV